MSKLKSRIEKLERGNGDGGGELKVHVVDGQIDRSEEDQLRDQGVDPERLGPNYIVVRIVT